MFEKNDRDLEYWRFDKTWFENLHPTEKANYYKCIALQCKEGVEALLVNDIRMAGSAVEYLMSTRTNWMLCFYYFMRWIHG